MEGMSDRAVGLISDGAAENVSPKLEPESVDPEAVQEHLPPLSAWA